MKTLIAALLLVACAMGGYAKNTGDQGSTPKTPLPTLTKTWKYGHLQQKGWAMVFVDGWGGTNYWCVDDRMIQCGYWDWKAEYPGIAIADDPCTDCNNPQYGDALVRAAAIEQEIELPPDLPLPTFSIEEGEE